MKDVERFVDISLPSVEREVEGHDSFMRKAHQNAWRDLSRLASNRTYAHQSTKICVHLDWSKVARRLLEISSKTQRRPPKRLSIKAKVAIIDKKPNAAFQWRNAPDLVSYHLCNVFLAMNISAPGSADFNGVRVSSSESHLDTEIDLSSYDYDYSWTSSREGKWPSIQEVPLEDCFQWLAPMESHVVTIADSEIERLMLSLLRLAQMDSSPDSVIWLCSGLEALFPTKVGRARHQLNTAISDLLEATEDQELSLTKCLDELYSLRNAFAHGNLPIVHPFLNEGLDERVNNEFDRYVDAHLDGVRLLLACVQRLVLKGAKI